MVDNLCSPAIMYLGFSLIQIIIDISRREMDKAMIKFILMCVFCLILNILCKRGLTPISWLIVFIPFISMTIITSLALYVFGFSNRNDIHLYDTHLYDTHLYDTHLYDTQSNSMGLDYMSMSRGKAAPGTGANLNKAQQLGECELSYDKCLANCNKSYLQVKWLSDILSADSKFVPKGIFYGYQMIMQSSLK